MRRIRAALTSLVAVAALTACADGITAPTQPQVETAQSEACETTGSSGDCFGGGTQGPNN